MPTISPSLSLSYNGNKGVVLDGDNLYIANPSNNIIIRLNLTSGTSIVWANSTNGVVAPYALEIYNNNLFCINTNASKQNIVRIHLQTKTSVDWYTSNLGSTYESRAAYISGGYLYVCYTNQTNTIISKINLFNPSDNTPSWYTITAKVITAIIAYNGYLYLGAKSTGIYKVSISNPAGDNSLWATLSNYSSALNLSIYGFAVQDNTLLLSTEAFQPNYYKTIARVNLLNPTGDNGAINSGNPVGWEYFFIYDTNNVVNSPYGIVIYNSFVYFSNNNATVGKVTVDALSRHKSLGSPGEPLYTIKIYKGYMYTLGSQLKKSTTTVSPTGFSLTSVDTRGYYHGTFAIYNDNIYAIAYNNTITVIDTQTYVNTVISLPATIGGSNASHIVFPHMYFGSYDTANASNSTIRRYNLNTGVLDLSWCTVGELTQSMTSDVDNRNLYIGGTSTIKRISITTPPVVTTLYTINMTIFGLAIYNGFLYASYTNNIYTGGISGVNKYDLNRPNEYVTNYSTGALVTYDMAYAMDIYNGYIYGMSNRFSSHLLISPTPYYFPPKDISLNSIQLVDVSSGNVQVSINDIYNTITDNIYYYYSLDGNTYTQTNTKADDSQRSINTFNITGLSRGSYSLYVKAVNSEGNSNIVSSSFGVYSNPVSFNSYSVTSSTSGNIDVSIIDTNNEVINNVGYYYYAYNTSTTPNNWFNVANYTYSGITKNALGNTYSFTISGLVNSVYTVYLIARNTTGNSVPVSSNVSVFTIPLSPNSYSLSFDELTGITVSITDTRNVAQNQVYYHYYYYRIGDTAPNQFTDISVYSNSYVPVVNGQTSYSFNITGLQTSYYNVYIAAKNSVGGNIYSPVIEPVNVICFKEDSRILTNRGYRKIQYLKRGDLVKTFKDGFKPIYKIGKKEIMHVPSIEERTKEQLYKCSPSQYPELFEDLVLTGCHSILVDEFVNDEQRTQTRKINGGIYVTDKKYRLPVCVDQRATVYEHAGKYTVYHIALENDDYYMNYGIYANGLLVESTSKRFLDEYNVMETGTNTPIQNTNDVDTRF